MSEFLLLPVAEVSEKEVTGFARSCPPSPDYDEHAFRLVSHATTPRQVAQGVSTA
jgi:hypothetical protein